MLDVILEWFVLDTSSPSGVVWAKDTSNNKVKKGQPALVCKHRDGYWWGQVEHRKVLAHRAVFALVHGYLPEMVDHIDGVRTNNTPGNLRPANRSINQQNQRTAKGCHFHRRSNKWVAQIGVGKVKHHLGYFKTEEDAHAAYLKAKQVYHPSAPINYEYLTRGN